MCARACIKDAQTEKRYVLIFNNVYFWGVDLDEGSGYSVLLGFCFNMRGNCKIETGGKMIEELERGRGWAGMHEEDLRGGEIQIKVQRLGRV